ncbi:hypothetical protein FRC01_005211, partial [Tulasnella sp. 417]
MARPTTRPVSDSAPPPHDGPPSSSLGGKVSDAKKVVLSILEDTAWPKEAANDVRALTQTIETPLDLDKLPKTEAQIPADVNALIEQVLRKLETAHARMKGESEKYGTKNKGLREKIKKKVKKVFSRTDPSRCIEVLRSCRTDIGESSTTLNNLLGILDAESMQPTLRVVEGESGDDSGAISTTQRHSTTTTAAAAATAGFGHTTNPSKSTPRPDSSASAPQVSQAASVQSGEQKGSPLRGELLNGANKAFKLADGISGALPVVGSFVGAVAKVGLTVVEMVQTMDENDETADRLRTNVCRLSTVLERVSNQARQPEKSETSTGMEDVQRELRDVQKLIENLQSQSSVKKFWRSADRSGSLKNIQEKVRAAVEEIQ